MNGLRTSAVFLTMTKFPLAIASWFGVAVVMVCGTTVCVVGDETVGWTAVEAVAVVGDAPVICTKLPLMFKTKKTKRKHQNNQFNGE